jgi:hypothetical protein
MTSPLPLQHANTVCYVDDFSSLPDHLVSDTIPQRTKEEDPEGVGENSKIIIR